MTGANDYTDLSLDEIRDKMNERYKEGTAYSSALPWDEDRTRRIREAVILLAHHPEERCAGARRSTGRTLDIGCGVGGIAAYWPHSDTVGVDLSDEAISVARRNFPARSFVAGAIENAELDKGSFQTVVAIESIEHWHSVSSGLGAIYEAMAPDGVFVLTTPNYDSLHHRIGRKLGLETPFCSSDHVHEFGYDELLSLLRASGFQPTRSLGIGLMPYWALEDEFGKKIRKLTDEDAEVIRWLGDAGTHVPHLAFIQAHACRRM